MLQLCMLDYQMPCICILNLLSKTGLECPSNSHESQAELTIVKRLAKIPSYAPIVCYRAFINWVPQKRMPIVFEI